MCNFFIHSEEMASGKFEKYEVGQLALVKMKNTDKYYWPVEIEGHESKHSSFKWLFRTSQT